MARSVIKTTAPVYVIFDKHKCGGKDCYAFQISTNCGQGLCVRYHGEKMGYEDIDENGIEFWHRCESCRKEFGNG